MAVLIIFILYETIDTKYSTVCCF